MCDRTYATMNIGVHGAPSRVLQGNERLVNERGVMLPYGRKHRGDIRPHARLFIQVHRFRYWAEELFDPLVLRSPESPYRSQHRFISGANERRCRDIDLALHQYPLRRGVLPHRVRKALNNDLSLCRRPWEFIPKRIQRTMQQPGSVRYPLQSFDSFRIRIDPQVTHHAPSPMEMEPE